MQLQLITSTQQTKGNLVYEYNPFRNYRFQSDRYYFRGKYLTEQELLNVLGSKKLSITNPYDWSEFKTSDNLHPITNTEQEPIYYPKGILLDFETDKFNFDLQHPINITPQWSYDGTVNLIINDNINTPKLINSRFSPLGQNKYQIIDRNGNNDTNIYDESQFETDVSLYKNYHLIPKIDFLGTSQGGNLSIGSYYFYFKYVDSDGNETDFISESGLVSIFKGYTKNKVNTGFKNENSHKIITFKLSNLDVGFQYINVYYTKSTAEINQSSNTTAYKINKSFIIGKDNICNIKITGNEVTTPITIEEINPAYFLAETVKTQTTCQNRLFFGNITKASINYKELADLSLHFIPQINSEKYYGYDPTYNKDYTNTYYDVKFIYNKTGYQKNEFYRFGVVYILNNNTLSPVFNIRGAIYNNSNDVCSQQNLYDDFNKRKYIQYDESTGIILSNTNFLENIYGVVKIYSDESELTNIFSLTINPDNGLKEELIKNNVKGYFFVRQNRIPLRVCQALTIGVLFEEGMPAPISYDSFITEKFIKDKKNEEGRKLLDEQIIDTTHKINNTSNVRYGALCPDYDVNYISLNSLFCGESYIIQPITQQLAFQKDYKVNNLFNLQDSIDYSNITKYTSAQILGIEDGVQQAGLNSKLYTSKLGEANEFRYSNNISNKESFEYRGIFGPYLAIDGYDQLGRIINIYYPNVTQDNLELLKTRVANQAAYYAISDRYNINDLTSKTCYRGDSYICTFTHRLNRNFINDSAPTNDTIVDPDTLANYIKNYTSTTKEHTINMGDLNTKKLGMWFTFPIVSNYNLNIRSLDESNADEMKITNHARGFYPYYDTQVISTTKTQEALCYNKGFAKSVSDRYNFELSDVAAIKNDFSNRIAYSDINVTDAFKNGFRVFQEKNYRDYPKTYGSITKLLELSGNILCVFEHGIALIPVNERVQTGAGDGGNIYINTNNVLPENPRIISDKLGSQWQDSIIKTSHGVYGVDTVFKKIWLVNDQGITNISDFYIQEFLNNNIILTEQETTPIIGIRNIKTIYNANKQDVIFTFYDNLEGFNETCWNICYNEILNKWITFYSWVPSFGENINNNLFTFDRETSKAISKLGTSNASYSQANGITLNKNIIGLQDVTDMYEGKNNIQLSITNRPYSTYKVQYFLEHDPFNNYKKFTINNNQLIINGNAPIDKYLNIVSELYKRTLLSDEEVPIDNLDGINRLLWSMCLLGTPNKVQTDEYGNKLLLDTPLNPDTIVTYLNIKAVITYDVKEENSISSITETIRQTIALISEWNMQFLTTAFWRHGQAGIFDNAENIKPTQWYGKQHPFEFEFVVADKPEIHKIFDNMYIVSNKAKPESFHYEIIGESYDFAKDKYNMYFRQEAIKSIWNYNGVNIKYDENYINMTPKQNIKSADLLHTYYDRQQPINQIYDYYVSKINTWGYDYNHISGAEIIKYKNRNEYRIQVHTKAIDLADQKDTTDDAFGGRGLIASNMRYLEDKWYVQINPLEIQYCNEYYINDYNILGDTTWIKSPSGKIVPPLSIFNSPIPTKIIQQNSFDLPTTGIYTATQNPNYYLDNKQWIRKQATIRDKFMKVKIRYKGDELAIINFINTLYEISYA